MTNNKVTAAQDALDAALAAQNTCKILLANASKWHDTGAEVRVVVDGRQVNLTPDILQSALNTQLVQVNKAVVEARRDLSIAVREWSEELAE